MADDKQLNETLKELTYQVSRLAAAVELSVLHDLSVRELDKLETCRCCGFRLMGPRDTALSPGSRCPACREER